MKIPIFIDSGVLYVETLLTRFFITKKERPARQPRVGQRAPERDLVGETSVAFVRKTAGCSFTEVIPVTLSQMEEAGVSRFECSTCKAVRDIKPKRDHVKFPSHPRRMTNTPNQGSRWVKRESTWRLSG